MRAVINATKEKGRISRYITDSSPSIWEDVSMKDFMLARIRI